MRGKVIVISAPSGSGKTTIVKYLLSEFPELIFSVSATTRKPRKGETHGKEYFFISEEEFKKKIEENQFVEWEKFYDYYYGTLRDYVDKNLDEGKFVVLELDVKGALNIKKQYPDAELIFIAPPSIEELKKRLIQRNTETEEDFKKRIERAEMEMSYKDKFDYVVINDNLDEAKQNAKKIIENIIRGG